MDIDYNEISFLSNPCNHTLHADYQQFLLSLTGPTVIDITGENQQKCSVITTLLHGNEPSGLIAIHRWLTSENSLPRPKTNIRIIIASVEAATSGQLFSQRYLTDGVDLNRCFNQTHQNVVKRTFVAESHSMSATTQGYHRRAQLIERAIREVDPVAIIDLHNTSGNGPAFAVCTVITPDALSLASYFCDTVILSSINLGALMEVNFGCPIVTIECGGNHDEQAHEVAYNGIIRFSETECHKIFPQEKSVQILYKPLRLILKEQRNLSYSEHDESYNGVTLKENIEQFNYGGCSEGQMLGWVDDLGLENLELLNDQGDNVIADYFKVCDQKLLCATNIKIFMATSKKEIAKQDCLFYVVNNINNY